MTARAMILPCSTNEAIPPKGGHANLCMTACKLDCLLGSAACMQIFKFNAVEARENKATDVMCGGKARSGID